MGYTRADLEIVLAQELRLAWYSAEDPPARAESKRSLIWGYTGGWSIPQLAELGARLIAENRGPTDELVALVNEYSRGPGVRSAAKNLIFAANGHKPELVLRDAIGNDVEITRYAENCLVYDRTIPADGLSFQALIDWWRDREQLDGLAGRDVGLALCSRLEASLAGNPAELLLFRTYLRRYRTHGFGIVALIPQVYLHFDPYTRAQRGRVPGPLPRQRMDFLILFSSRRRVVIEVDGRQHYADPDGRASTARYAEMVAEDRRLRLDGYEVFRFGGAELTGPGAVELVARFFDDLHERMSA